MPGRKRDDLFSPSGNPTHKLAFADRIKKLYLLQNIVHQYMYVLQCGSVLDIYV